MRLINWFINLKAYIFLSSSFEKKIRENLKASSFKQVLILSLPNFSSKRLKSSVAGVSAPLTEFEIGEQCAANFKTQTKNFLNFQVNQYLVIERKETYLLAHSNLLPRLIAIRQRIYVVNLISILNCHQ